MYSNTDKMSRDIIDIHRCLDLKEFMKLDMDFTDDLQNTYALINPSKALNHIYFRTVMINNIFENGILLYNSITGQFVPIPTDDRCRKLEDLRIFDLQGQLWFVGCARNLTSGIFETYIGHFNASFTHIDSIVGHIRNDDVHIKNITPLLEAETSRAWLVDIYTGSAYSCEEDGVKRCHDIDITLIGEKLSQYINPVFGTSQYIHLNDSTYGGLVHITKHIGELLCYVYVWLEIDISNWKVTFVSDPFIVHKLGVVFVSYIEKLQNGDIHLMFGVDDKMTCRAVTSLSALRGNRID